MKTNPMFECLRHCTNTNPAMCDECSVPVAFVDEPFEAFSGKPSEVKDFLTETFNVPYLKVKIGRDDACEREVNVTVADPYDIFPAMDAAESKFYPKSWR